MNREENTLYYARRARQERDWAERATNDATKQVHFDLAAAYERRIEDDRGTP